MSFIEKSELSGVFIEAGCALGGSSILIATVKGKNRSLFVYDVFGMILSPIKEDTQDVHNRYKTIVKGESKGLGGDKYFCCMNMVVYGLMQLFYVIAFLMTGYP